jgi:uncharacterized protein YcfL
MKKIIAVLALLTLSACNSIDVSTVVPSFWDDNQSRSIINTYQLVVNIDCKEPQAAQAQSIIQRKQRYATERCSKTNRAYADYRKRMG